MTQSIPDPATVFTPEKASKSPAPTFGPAPGVPLVFIDIETISLDPNTRPWDVAMIVREYADNAGSFTETTVQMFVDVDLAHADPYALRLGKYWDRHPAGRYQSRHRRASTPTPRDPRDFAIDATVSEARAAAVVAEWTHGACLVGVNPAFDAGHLTKMLNRHGRYPGWDYHLLDVLALTAGRLQLPPPWKSSEIAAAAGAAPTPEHEQHTALGDARWAARIYDAVMGGAA